MHIHSANRMNTVSVGVRKKRTRSRVNIMPKSVAIATVAATGISETAHEYRWGFMMLMNVQPMMPSHGWNNAETARAARIDNLSASPMLPVRLVGPPVRRCKRCARALAPAARPEPARDVTHIVTLMHQRLPPPRGAPAGG